jgi:putative exosortase-associated protein (TIGR04073 family)
MRKLIFPIAAALAAMFVAGCTGPEQKLGRGISNSWDIVRLGEMRRTVEQVSLLNSPDEGYTTGVIRGADRSVQRSLFGVYEIVTFPFPPYHPVLTKYFCPHPAYPESYKPGLISDPLFDTDTYTGFSGGDIAPFIPGSRFAVFPN